MGVVAEPNIGTDEPDGVDKKYVVSKMGELALR